MDEMHTLYRKIINISWIIIIIISIILVLVSLIFFKDELWYKFMVSYILGAMTSLFAFNLLKNNVAGMDDNKKRVITSTISNYFIRLIIYGFILYFSFQSEKLNPYLVFSGFFTVKIAIYIYELTDKKRKEVAI